MPAMIRKSPGAALFLAVCLATGCSRTETRSNSDPGPGRHSGADSGAPTTSTTGAAPTSAPAQQQVGKDSRGLPADSSGGTAPSVDAAGQPAAPAKK